MIIELVSVSTADRGDITVSEMTGRTIDPNLVLLTYVTEVGGSGRPDPRSVAGDSASAAVAARPV